MADSNAVVSEPESADTKTVAAPKKTRAPRQAKATTTPVAKADPVKRGKRTAKAPVEAASKAVDTSKKTPKASQPRPATAKVATSSTSTGDDFADLMQLEDENKQLRKMLADKLRGENADLKKKLGIA